MRNKIFMISASLVLIGAPVSHYGLNTFDSIRNLIKIGEVESIPSPSPSKIIIETTPSQSQSVSVKPTPRISHVPDPVEMDPYAIYGIEFTFVNSSLPPRYIQDMNTWFLDYCMLEPVEVVAAQNIGAYQVQKKVNNKWASANDVAVTTTAPGGVSFSSCDPAHPGFQIYIIYAGGAQGLAEQAASGQVTQYRLYSKGNQVTVEQPFNVLITKQN